MGQAILDLPDPTQLSGINSGPLSPEALASADDLLSQLAGDDIDRLLAEADAQRPPLPPASAPAQAAPPPAALPLADAPSIATIPAAPPPAPPDAPAPAQLPIAVASASADEAAT